MNKNNFLKKGWAVAVILLFVGMSMLPVTGSISIERVSTTSQIYKISSGDDTTPPVTTIYFDPAEPDGLDDWYVSDVTITLEATDDMSGVDFIKYLLDDNDWLTYTQPFKVYDGYHRITYYAVDKAGNVEQPSEVLRFKVDLTDPEIKKFVWEAYNENQKWYVKFTVKCSDTLSGMDRVEFYMEEELWFTDYDEPYEWTLEWSEDYANKVWKAVAFDKAGNSDEDDTPDPVPYWSDSEIISNSESTRQNTQQSSSIPSSQNTMSVIPSTENMVFNDDTTPPVTTCMLDPPTPDGDNDWYVSAVDICLHATDDLSGVKAIYYRVDNGEWRNHAGEFLHFIVVEDGEHVVEYYSVDNAGNKEDVKSAEFKIDKTSPEIDVTWEKITKNKIKFTADVFDATSGVARVEFYLNDELKFTDYDFPFEWIWKYSDGTGVTGLETMSPIGPTFLFIVYDRAGNSDAYLLPSPNSQSQQNTQQSNNQQFISQFFFQILERLLCYQ